MKNTYIQIGNNAKVDIKSAYGVYFTSSSISSLMTPASMKESAENDSRLQHGTRDIDCESDARFDKKDLSLEMHISAPTEDAFLANFNNFCNDILSKRYFTLTTDYIPNTYYRVRYESCPQFSEWSQRIGKFMLKLTETDPTNRAEIDYHLTEND